VHKSYIYLTAAIRSHLINSSVHNSVYYIYIGGPPYPRVIRSKTYRGYVKPRIIPNVIYYVIFM